MAVKKFKYALTDMFANSFVSLDEANDYFDDKIDVTDWTENSDNKKQRALIEATRLINSFRYGWKLTPNQALKMPNAEESLSGGTADSGSTTTLIDSELADDEAYYDDYWNNGAVRIIDGTNKNEVRRITDFDVSTGQITCEEFDSAIDSTSRYQLVRPLPEQFKTAVYECALWIIKGKENNDGDTRVKSLKIGNVSKTFFNYDNEVKLPPNVMNYLMDYIDRTGRII